MYQFAIEPMFQHRRNAVGDPTTRFQVLMVYVPASIVDWSKATVMGENLTFEEAEALEEKLEKTYGQTDPA